MTTTTNNAEYNLGYAILISLVATIGGFLFGFDSGVINGTVDGLTAAFDSDAAVTGFNVASMLLGCAVGAFFAGRLSDHYGRRSMLVVAAVFFVISAYGSGVATGSAEFIIYRIIGGLAVGAASVMSPAYISEVAPAHLRGRLSSIQQVAIITGLFAAFVSNYSLAEVAGKSTEILWFGFEAWRWMFWIELVPAIVFLVALFLIPESPRFLVVKGDKAGAQKVLSKLNGDSAGKILVDEIDASLAKDHHQPTLSDLLDKTSGKIHPIVWIGIGLATFQQLVGINVVFYYGAVLWQAVGFSESDALLINILGGAISIAAVGIALLTIDRIGRKPLLKWGSIGMTVTLATVGYAFSTASLTDSGVALSDEMGIIALVAANAYVFFFNMSWGPVMWVALGEMFPNQIRGSGLAVAGLFQWGSNFLITWTFPMLLAGIGLAAAYGIYAVFALLSVIFVVKMVRETKGMRLEDMTS